MGRLLSPTPQRLHTGIASIYAAWALAGCSNGAPPSAAPRPPSPEETAQAAKKAAQEKLQAAFTAKHDVWQAKHDHLVRKCMSEIGVPNRDRDQLEKFCVDYALEQEPPEPLMPGSDEEKQMRKFWAAFHDVPEERATTVAPADDGGPVGD